MTRTLYAGGTIVTNLAGAPITDAIAVADGRVVALGDEARGWSAGWDEVVDLRGRCVVPGFRDGHAHPVHAGEELLSLNLAPLGSVDEVIAAVRDWAASHPAVPGDEWIVGGSYISSILPDGVGDAAWLDAVCPDRPVALFSNDHHVMWANSRALAVAGIDAATPEPATGQIVRRADGSPIGTLREFGAIELVERVMPGPDPARSRGGLGVALAELARRGIVWVQDAIVDETLLGTYLAGADAGELTCRFNAAFRAEPGRWLGQRDQFVAGREQVRAHEGAHGWVTANTVKFFADGVIEAGTGFLVEPYEDAPHSCGLPNWAPAELNEAVRMFDAEGFQIHIHAIGDGGVRMALDAIEHAARQNGPADRRPVIAHTQLVHPDDRPRFAALGVIANFEPLWAQLDPVMRELTIPRLGEARSALQYPIGSLVASGARISFGSDWPVTTVNPLDGLGVAVSRQTPDGHPLEGWCPGERVPMLTAIAAYTAGSAYQAFDDDRTTLGVGAPADLLVLGADITAIDGNEARDVEVDRTVLHGRAVYQAA
ncbi:MAG: amidohydrolase [Acidimicrobiales bacterium]